MQLNVLEYDRMAARITVLPPHDVFCHFHLSYKPKMCTILVEYKWKKDNVRKKNWNDSLKPKSECHIDDRSPSSPQSSSASSSSVSVDFDFPKFFSFFRFAATRRRAVKWMRNQLVCKKNISNIHFDESKSIPMLTFINVHFFLFSRSLFG